MLRQREEHIQYYEDPREKPDYIEADVQALRAVNGGHATPEQQTRAMRWMISAFGTYDTSFRRGGPEADRDTNFAEGRRHAGQILVYMLKYAPAKTNRDKIAVRVFGESGGEQADDRQL